MDHRVLWSHTCTFPAEAGSAAGTRSFISGHLREHDLPHLVEDVRLVASELATNAMLHARTPFAVSIQRLVGAVLLSVRDGSPVAPQPAGASPTEVRGRGLLLVDHLSHDWGVTLGPGRSKSVWASFVTPPSRADVPRESR